MAVKNTSATIPDQVSYHHYDINMMANYWNTKRIIDQGESVLDESRAKNLLDSLNFSMRFHCEENGWDVERMIQGQIPIIITSRDPEGVYWFQLALKLNTMDWNLIHLLLYYQLEQHSDQDAFVDHVEFMVYTIAKTNSIKSNDPCLKSIIDWVMIQRKLTPPTPIVHLNIGQSDLKPEAAVVQPNERVDNEENDGEEESLQETNGSPSRNVESIFRKPELFEQCMRRLLKKELIAENNTWVGYSGKRTEIRAVFDALKETGYIVTDIGNGPAGKLLAKHFGVPLSERSFTGDPKELYWTFIDMYKDLFR